MSAISKAAWLPVCALAGLHFITLSAQAQPEPATGPARAPRAADPAAAVADVPYRSPFAGYRSFSEATVAPWRESNETVRQRGGWRAYAREASGPAAASASGPATTPASPDASHRMK
jgi:hypothetical protein